MFVLLNMRCIQHHDITIVLIMLIVTAFGKVFELIAEQPPGPKLLGKTCWIPPQHSACAVSLFSL